MFDGPLSESIIARAVQRELVEIHLHDIRDYATDRHRSVDDYPFGGGYGMVMKPEPIFDAVRGVKSGAGLADDTPVVLLTPQGTPLTQRIVERLAISEDLILICGRYEGVDARVAENLATREISVGDYVLSGGELAAMIVIDAVTRLIPGAVGSIESTQDDTFSTGLLQFPQYTRPAVHDGRKCRKCCCQATMVRLSAGAGWNRCVVLLCGGPTCWRMPTCRKKSGRLSRHCVRSRASSGGTLIFRLD